jgi:arylformamidase
MVAKNSAWYDSMYNNRALVPDFETHFSRWIEGSQSARASLKCQLDIVYGDGPNETLDIFPAKNPNAPVVFFIHGGYWRSLDKSDHSFVAPALHDMDVCVVVVNYALCPGTKELPITIPDIAVQMTKALAWTWRNIAQYGGNPKNVMVGGHSAGGHLAAMLLACDWKHAPALDSKSLVDFRSVRPHTLASDTLLTRVTQSDGRACANGQSRIVASADARHFVHGGRGRREPRIFKA